MYAGAQKLADGRLRSWTQIPVEERSRDTVFAIRQDVRLLNEHIVRHAFRQPLQRLIARRNLSANDIDWFLPHMSSEYFRQPIADCLQEIGFAVPPQRWFTNLTTKGNTGSAAFYIMLDELFNSGRLEPEQRLLCFIPESGRFSSAFVSLRAVLPC